MHIAMIGAGCVGLAVSLRLPDPGSELILT